ncbi:MAG: ATP-dependent helicase, partial [Actinomycetota bacterium]
MPKQIACGHCGRSHGSVAEVRACAMDGAVPDAGGSRAAASQPVPNTAWGANGPDSDGFGQERGLTPPPADDGRPPTRRAERRPAVASSPPAAAPMAAPADLPELFTAERLAGPEALGRSLLVAADAPIPAPWSTAPVVEADQEASEELVERLHRAWRERERLVIRWSGPPPSAAAALDESFVRWSPSTSLPGERLAFAVTANAVDLLGHRPAFAPLQLALALGAEPPSPTEEGGADGNTAADAVVDGVAVHVDGGPLTPFASTDIDHPIVPRVHLVAGILRAVPTGLTPSQADLAPDQLAAVHHEGGPARIIAPAGSGKTRVLTERTRHLIADRGLAGRTVSLVAYNRRARTEMAERLADHPGLDVRTLNSMAFGIALGRPPFHTAAPGASNLTTVGELDARRILERLVPGRRRRQLTDPLEPWVDALSACRLGLRDPEEVEAAYGADITGFAEVLPRYREELARRNLVDFDEQILTAITRLLTEPDARAAARRATPLLLVDEFQDLTPAHLILVRLLAGPAAEVFAVGDDDQTIYGYSGASPEWLVDFDRFFPGAADHRLTVNYRCPPPVVDAALHLLSHNRLRVTKTITAGRPTPDAPAPAALDELAVNESSDPNLALVARAEALTADGVAPADIAVLARVNATLLPALLHLAEAGLPVERPRAIDERVLERSGTAAALAWLRLASAPEQRLADDDLRLALRRPPRSLHPRIVDWVCEQSSVKALRALSERLNSERDANNVAGLADDIEALRAECDRGATAAELLDEIFDTIGLLGAASQLDQSQRTARRAAHADELMALRAVADLAPGPYGFEPWLRERLNELRPSQPDEPGPAEAQAERPNVITLATIHTTKGLEWDHVIVHDVRRDLHPHRLATDIEEERRIFHVAVTRGRSTVLVNAMPGGGSPFLEEMEKARPADEPWPEPVVSRSAPSAAGATKAAKGKAARAEPGSPAAAARREALTAW